MTAHFVIFLCISILLSGELTIIDRIVLKVRGDRWWCDSVHSSK